MKYKKTFCVLAVIMAVLGCSDALRGVYLPVFANHFSLTAAQQGMIITVSYAGNVTFLLLGGRLLAKLQQKKAVIIFLCIWLCAVCAFLLSNSYGMLLCGIFCSLGASSMVGMLINLLTPQLTDVSPAFFVNLLFFVQGFGTVSGQFIVGRIASTLSDWKLINALLLAIGLAAGVLMLKSPFPSAAKTKQEGARQKPSVIKDKVTWLLIAVFGFYFIAEHSVFNWFIAYATQGLKLSQAQAANYLAVFSLGIMFGRLILSPLIDKLGMIKCMLCFGAVGTVLYGIGALSGVTGALIWAASGLFFSIMYPTLVVSLGGYYSKQNAAGAASVIISAASLFDILFNYMFGNMVDINGYSGSIWVLPLSAALFLALLACFAICLKHCKVNNEHTK